VNYETIDDWLPYISTKTVALPMMCRWRSGRLPIRSNILCVCQPNALSRNLEHGYSTLFQALHEPMQWEKDEREVVEYYQKHIQ